MRKTIFVILGIGAVMAAILFLNKGVPQPSKLSDGETGANAIPDASARGYRMAFSIMLPPSSKGEDYLQRKFAQMSKYSDALIEHPDVPWEALLAGENAQNLAQRLLPPVTLARSKGMKIYIMLEPLDGLDRRSESPILKKAGKSITNPEVQELYRDYALAIAKIVKPEALGIAAEVNAFQALGPSGSYRALVSMTNDIRKELKKGFPSLPIYASVAADIAWGAPFEPGTFKGVKNSLQDFSDFDLLSLTVYPMLAWENPKDIPDDYLSRIVKDWGKPVIIDESGWPSRFKKSTPELEAQWIKELAAQANSVNAQLVAQLVFNDAEARYIGNSDGWFFGSQGLVTEKLEPKPALLEWEKMFKLPHN